MAAFNNPADGFAGLFLRFRDRLSRAVSRIVQPNDVEDIVQETFLRCYQASAKAPIRHPRAFMLTTAKNLALNHVAKADNRLVRGVASLDDSAVPLYRERQDNCEPERSEEFLLLCRAVRTLPLQCRRAFILKKVYGLSRKEIASYMGIAESTVQKHVAKGVLICAEFLERVDAAPAHVDHGPVEGDALLRKADR
jgi:RNA polymerase sigma-70 factor (ECF subfamily)